MTTHLKLQKIRKDVQSASVAIVLAERHIRSVMANLAQLSAELAVEVPESDYDVSPPKDYPPPR